MMFGWIECIIHVVSRRRCRNKAEFPEVNVFSTLKNHNSFKKEDHSQDNKTEEVRSALAGHRIYICIFLL